MPPPLRIDHMKSVEAQVSSIIIIPHVSSKLYRGIVWTNWVPPTMILVGSMFWWSTDPSHLPLAIRLVPPVTQFTLCVRSASAITEQSVVQVDVTMQSFDIFTPACVRAPWWSLLCSRPCVCAHQHFHSQSSDSWESLSWGKTIVWQKDKISLLPSPPAWAGVTQFVPYPAKIRSVFCSRCPTCS